MPPVAFYRPHHDMLRVASVLWTLALFVVFVAVFIAISSLAAYSGLIYQGILTAQREEVVLFLILPFTVVARVADTGFFLLYFTLVLSAILAMFLVLLAKDGREALRLITSPLENFKERAFARNSWILVSEVFAATLFIQYLYIFAIMASGGEPTTPLQDGSTWYLLYALANASVYEELVTRILLLGLPLTIGSLFMRMWNLRHGKGGTRVYVRGSLRYMVGGNVSRKSNTAAIVASLVLLLFSSILFGVAHYASWGLWKIFPATIAGLGMGYVFLRRGIAAAILFHFTNNYLAAAIIANPNDTAVLIVTGLLTLALLVAGAFFLVIVLYYLIDLFLDLGRRYGIVRPKPAPASAPGSSIPSLPPPPPVIPPPPTPPPSLSAFNFQCPFCGWQEARYADGRFTCTRCGRSP